MGVQLSTTNDLLSTAARLGDGARAESGRSVSTNNIGSTQPWEIDSRNPPIRNSLQPQFARPTDDYATDFSNRNDQIMDNPGQGVQPSFQHAAKTSSPPKSAGYAGAKKEESPKKQITGRPFTPDDVVPSDWKWGVSLRQSEPYEELPVKAEGGLSSWYRHRLRAPSDLKPKTNCQQRVPVSERSAV